MTALDFTMPNDPRFLSTATQHHTARMRLSTLIIPAVAFFSAAYADVTLCYDAAPFTSCAGRAIIMNDIQAFCQRNWTRDILIPQGAFEQLGETPVKLAYGGVGGGYENECEDKLTTIVR